EVCLESEAVEAVERQLQVQMIGDLQLGLQVHCGVATLLEASAAILVEAVATWEPRAVVQGRDLPRGVEDTLAPCRQVLAGGRGSVCLGCLVGRGVDHAVDPGAA